MKLLAGARQVAMASKAIRGRLIETEVYDTYWRFAAERQSIYIRRLANPIGPWSDDPILNEFRFTNVYRISDRVSQYLVRNVQYDPTRPTTPSEVFFRTLLFKIFNRIETWEALERRLGPIVWQATPLHQITKALDDHVLKGNRIYSAAYIMPPPSLGLERKHENHLALLSRMMKDRLADRLASADSLRAAYEMILAYPGIGPFLAFQYCIDLNYSTLMNFDEGDFVVAGPGALDGIAKCFYGVRAEDSSGIIFKMAERQEEEFDRLQLPFPGLFGRRLQPIDCQNIFCEVAKYARLAHPHVKGTSGRQRIKQRYRLSSDTRIERPFFPPKWCLDRTQAVEESAEGSGAGQMELFGSEGA